MSKPELIYHGCGNRPDEEANPRMEQLISNITLLQEKYRPPKFWGYSAHLQTAYFFSSRRSRPGLDLTGLTYQRHEVVLKDGTTVSYDVFEAENKKEYKDDSLGDITVALCPGMASTSRDLYIRALTSQAIGAGYRVAVLNHLGMIKDSLTTPRIFNLGSTEEYGAMVADTMRHYPQTRLIAVGLSMGGSLVCKYLGEKKENQKHFIACVSACQAFNYNRVKEDLLTWKRMKKVYARQLSAQVRYSMTKNWKILMEHPLIRQHEEQLREKKIQKKNQLQRSFSTGSTASLSGQYNIGSVIPRVGCIVSSVSILREVFSSSKTCPAPATTDAEESEVKPEMNGHKSELLSKLSDTPYLHKLSDIITIKMTGHDSVQSYQEWASSYHYLENIDVPTLYVNSKDDPVFSCDFTAHAVDKIKSHRDSLLVLPAHGGHLAFFTKTGRAKVDPHTWLERLIVQYMDALVDQIDTTQAQNRNNVE